LSLAANRVTPPLVERLKDVLATHPGTTEVHLDMTSSGRSTRVRLDDTLRVTASAALMADLKQLLGPAAIA
jgi:DNA polymerase-3 subunit alpha